MTDTATTPTTPAKRKPGRPKGSTTKRPARPTGPQSPQAPAPTITMPAEPSPTIAEQVAAAATPDVGSGVGRPSKAVKLADSLAESYDALGKLLMIPAMFIPGPTGVRCQLVGAALSQNAQACGNALAHLAETNPRVRKWLTEGSQFAAAGMVLAVHGPIIGAAFAPVGPKPEPSPEEQAAAEMMGGMLSGLFAGLSKQPDGYVAPDGSGNPLGDMLAGFMSPQPATEG